MATQPEGGVYNPPVTDAERAEIRRLHAEGKGRNEIAKAIGRGGRTNSRQAALMNLTFDRTQTARATEAKMVDAKARRIAIIERLYARVEATLDRLDKATEGGFKYTTSTGQGIDTISLDHVPGQEEKAFAAAIGQYLNQSTRLEALDSNNGVDEGISLLGQLATGLTAAYNAMTEGAGDAP